MIESEYGTNPLDLMDLKTFQIQSVSRAQANIYKQLGFFFLNFKNISASVSEAEIKPAM